MSNHEATLPYDTQLLMDTLPAGDDVEMEVKAPAPLTSYQVLRTLLNCRRSRAPIAYEAVIRPLVWMAEDSTMDHKTVYTELLAVVLDGRLFDPAPLFKEHTAAKLVLFALDQLIGLNSSKNRIRIANINHMLHIITSLAAAAPREFAPSLAIWKQLQCVLSKATAWLLEDGTLETVELDEPWNWSQTQVDVMTRTLNKLANEMLCGDASRLAAWVGMEDSSALQQLARRIEHVEGKCASQVAELSKKLAETEEDRNNLEQMMENAAASRDLVDDRAAQLVLREQKVQELEDKCDGLVENCLEFKALNEELQNKIESLESRERAATQARHEHVELQIKLSDATGHLRDLEKKTHNIEHDAAELSVKYLHLKRAYDVLERTNTEYQQKLDSAHQTLDAQKSRTNKRQREMSEALTEWIKEDAVESAAKRRRTENGSVAM